MMRRTRIQVVVIIHLVFGGITVGEKCGNWSWEKVDGMMPENYVASDILYSAADNDGIVTTCFDRCLNANCTAFFIDIEQSTCSKVTTNSEKFETAPTFTYYHKICLPVPIECSKDRIWQVQRTLGEILIDTTVNWLPEVMTRSKCYQKCIAAGNRCKSAQFRASIDLAISDVQGICALLSIERGIRPQSYRAAPYRDEYLEIECHKLSNTDYCSYAEFKNETLPYSDLKLINYDAKQCEERCNESNDGFICRGYTIDYASKYSPVCLLHSYDTITAGVSSLVKATNAIYKEREPCLNLKVSCGNSSVIIELDTPEPFNGRLYASGYSETCNVQGTGLNKTILELRIPDKKEMGNGNIDCGILPAYAIEDNNQTRVAVWVTVVVQFNAIIQRLGDQSVRVGCTLDDEVPGPRNITIGSGFDFLNPNAGLPPIVGTIFNTTASPMVSMRILDENMREITSAELGQRLVLAIEMNPPDGPYDMAAGHLVASSTSGDASILLLDEMGCPTDAKIFPGMFKDPANNKSLISTFTAFKFPDSYRVKFNVIVRFCLSECPSTKCKGDIVSYGRRKRSMVTVAEWNEVNSEIDTIEELPLESSIIVRDAVIAADPLRSGKSDTIFLAGEQSMEGLLCVDAALALGLLIFWLIVQILLTMTCIYVIRKYRRVARKAEEDRADILTRHLYGIHGGNFEISRRVRWADHNGSTIS
ncbi:hypothetical protein G9C98_002034 [Cotesia typhae]|uniref:Uncharacterized protein n=1 Tax=Cotesia typhae TaxID=2053667 RepID=A0A8J5RGU8_9HYME|nr:hypothetical protein G9C98_002034 [Cotesia typhae]